MGLYHLAGKAGFAPLANGAPRRMTWRSPERGGKRKLYKLAARLGFEPR